MSVLVLVRHGQASFGSDDYDRLSEVGRVQARLLGEHLARVGARFDAAYAGPLVRQRDTAAIVAEAARASGMAFPEPELLCGLDEYAAIPLGRALAPQMAEDFPEHAEALESTAKKNGLVPGELVPHFVGLTRRWIRGELFFQDVEPWADFLARVRGAFETVRARHPRGARVVAFTSGGTIGAVLRHVLGIGDDMALDMAWSVQNSSISQVRYDPDRATLVRFNCTPHLGPELLTVR